MTAAVYKPDGFTRLAGWLQAYILLPIRGQLSRISAEASPAVPAENAREQAAEALRQHGDSILRLAFSYLHNYSDAEDVLQDALVQLMQSAPAFTGEEHRKAWLLRVTMNICKNRLKYNKRRDFEELSESIPMADDPDLSFVWQAVGELPVQYREAVHLFYQEDMTTAQIAALLHKKEGTVRTQLTRARAMLKEKLKEAYDF